LKLTRSEVDSPDLGKQFGTFMKLDGIPMDLVHQVVTLYHDKQSIQHEFMLEPRENARPEQGQDTWEYNTKEHLKDRSLKMAGIPKISNHQDILKLKADHDDLVKKKEAEAIRLAEAAEHMAGASAEDRVAHVARAAAASVSMSGSRFAKRPIQEAALQPVAKRRRQ
jgi:hypothetical protein